MSKLFQNNNQQPYELKNDTQHTMCPHMAYVKLYHGQNI